MIILAKFTSQIANTTGQCCRSDKQAYHPPHFLLKFIHTLRGIFTIPWTVKLMNISLKNFTPSRQSHCQTCFFDKICSPSSALNAALKSQVLAKQMSLERNQLLCKPREKFHNLYVVRSGALKAWDLEIAGKIRITHFYLPGDILGFEAIFPEKYDFSVSAITETTICELTTTKLLQFSAGFPEWLPKILSLFSRRINIGDYLTRTGAEQKVSGFLLELSQRLPNRKDSAFTLPMSRQDIASYLGIAAETVSRILTSFQQQNLISVNKKQIKLLNLPRLEQIVQGATSCFS